MHYAMPRLPILLALSCALAGCGLFGSHGNPTGGATVADSTSHRWLCRASATRAWECFDAERPIPSPARAPGLAQEKEPPPAGRDAVSRRAPIAPPPEPQTPVRLPEPTTPATGVSEPEPATPGPASDEARLLAAPATAFVAQLVAARQLATIDELRERYSAVADQLLLTTDPDTGLMLLFLGPFANRGEAESAIAGLEPAPDATPWIRIIGPLQESLR